MRLSLITLLLVGVIAASCKKEKQQDIHTPQELSLDELVLSGVDLRFNPYGVTPLASEVVFETLEPCLVEVCVTSSAISNAYPIRHTFAQQNTKFELPVLGFYAGVPNQVELIIRRNNGDSTIYRTEVVTKPLREEIMDIEIVKCVESKMDAGLNFAILAICPPNSEDLIYAPVASDRNGDIRWALDLFAANLPTDGGFSGFLANGNIASFYQNEMTEYTICGELKRRISFGDYVYHHDYCELPNGNLLLAVDKNGLSTIEDHVIEIDRNSGALLNEIDLRPILDLNRGGVRNTPDDWFHNNSVYYVEEDNSIVLSGQRQGVVKVDRATGALKWIFSPHNDWKTDSKGNDLKKSLLTAVNSIGIPYPENVQLGESSIAEFDWGWGQHNVTITSEGTMLLFDNGFNRNYQYPMSADYSRIVEYQIDEQAKTVRQLWQFGYNQPQYVSYIISSAIELSNGNRLMGSGTSTPELGAKRGKVVELSDNDIVFEATYIFKNLGKISDVVYRTIRRNLYHD